MHVPFNLRPCPYTRLGTLVQAMWLLGHPFGPCRMWPGAPVREAGDDRVQVHRLNAMGTYYDDFDGRIINPNWLRFEEILKRTFGASTRRNSQLPRGECAVPHWVPNDELGKTPEGYPPDHFGNAYKERYHCLLSLIRDMHERDELPADDEFNLDEDGEVRLGKALELAMTSVTLTFLVAKSLRMQCSWIYWDPAKGAYCSNNRTFSHAEAGLRNT